uniref:Uncharacterized protein n=1 Tax=Alexandrium monilatum TaxID=311494 RepID=A0A7S4UZY3_9DINO
MSTSTCILSPPSKSGGAASRPRKSSHGANVDVVKQGEGTIKESDLFPHGAIDKAGLGHEASRDPKALEVPFRGVACEAASRAGGQTRKAPSRRKGGRDEGGG